MRHVESGAGFITGMATVWHSAVDWGTKLLFSLLIAVLAPHAGRLADALFRHFKKSK